MLCCATARLMSRMMRSGLSLCSPGKSDGSRTARGLFVARSPRMTDPSFVDRTDPIADTTQPEGVEPGKKMNGSFVIPGRAILQPFCGRRCKRRRAKDAVGHTMHA